VNYSLVSVDGVQFSISLPITDIGEWLTSIVVRYLVSILTVFWLLLIFVHLLIFFFLCFFFTFTLTFRVLFVGLFFSTRIHCIFLYRADEERRLSPRNIRFVVFFQYFHLAFKNPIFARFSFFMLCQANVV
jgi:hypothetical protein